jgi:hypothetical protein
MFTLEESALLSRMLRTTAAFVICAITGIGYLLFRPHASHALSHSPSPAPVQHASVPSPALRHAPHYVPPPVEAHR